MNRKCLISGIVLMENPAAIRVCLSLLCRHRFARDIPAKANSLGGRMH